MVIKNDYYSEQLWNNFLKESKKYQTPFVLVSIDKVQENYNKLTDNFPYAKIFYAIKANPNIEILKRLVKLGSNFDIASRYELDKIKQLNIDPSRISYGNTIKKFQDIKYFYDNGVRIFATDSFQDMRNIAKYAPNSKIFCRFLCQGGNASWSLSKKFGCQPQMCIQILKEAKQLNLTPYGVNFHVGSQQHDIQTWYNALLKTNYIFDELKKDNIFLQCVNMGGGLPCQYKEDIQSIQTYSSNIKKYLSDIFKDSIPCVFMQPGRSLVGDAGILVTQIIQCSKKHLNDDFKWCYIDAGKFNGLIETIDQSILYNILQQWNQEKQKFIIAGPTCDSMDIVYQKNLIKLNKNSKEKDRLYFLSCGAYTTTYASVEFNGFTPIKIYTF